MKEYIYYNNSANWPANDIWIIGGFRDLHSKKERITRKAFLRNVNIEDLREVERDLGFEKHHKQGQTMATANVGYFRSLHHWELVYGFEYNGVSYVFKAIPR